MSAKIWSHFCLCFCLLNPGWKISKIKFYLRPVEYLLNTHLYGYRSIKTFKKGCFAPYQGSSACLGNIANMAVNPSMDNLVLNTIQHHNRHKIHNLGCPKMIFRKKVQDSF